MTSVFAGIGVCYLVAYGLKRVRLAGRLTLLLGGSLFDRGGSRSRARRRRHRAPARPGHRDGLRDARGLALPGRGRRSIHPWPLRPAISAAFTALVLASADWFLTGLNRHRDACVAERAVTGLHSLWPVIVAAGLRYSAGQQGRRNPDGEASQRGACQAPPSAKPFTANLARLWTAAAMPTTTSTRGHHPVGPTPFWVIRQSRSLTSRTCSLAE